KFRRRPVPRGKLEGSLPARARDSAAIAEVTAIRACEDPRLQAAGKAPILGGTSRWSPGLPGGRTPMKQSIWVWWLGLAIVLGAIASATWYFSSNPTPPEPEAPAAPTPAP